MKRIIFGLIVWYLRRKCGGAFHSFTRNHRWLYVVSMTDREYHFYTTLVRGRSIDDLAQITQVARNAGLWVP